MLCIAFFLNLKSSSWPPPLMYKQSYWLDSNLSARVVSYQVAPMIGYARAFVGVSWLWHVESSYKLQPPKYLLLFVNRFKHINNNVTKDRCSIPMDTTVRLGPLNYTASIKHSIATITQLRSLVLLIAKTPLLHMLYYMNCIWVLDSNRRVGVWSLPWCWHILSIPLITGRGTGAETCGLDDVFPPDDLCSRPEALC